MNKGLFAKLVGSATFQYMYSCYNATTKLVTHDVFSAAGVGLVKVDSATGEVVEFYRPSVVINGKTYPFVSYMPGSNAPIDCYEQCPGGLKKTPLAGGYSTITACTKLPDDIAAQVADFRHKANIARWSRKPYGNVVEFAKPINERPTYEI